MTDSQILDVDGMIDVLACDVCLRRPATMRVSGTPQRRLIVADCASCGTRRPAELTGEQAALLWRLNRRVGYVHFSADSI